MAHNAMGFFIYFLNSPRCDECIWMQPTARREASLEKPEVERFKERLRSHAREAHATEQCSDVLHAGGSEPACVSTAATADERFKRLHAGDAAALNPIPPRTRQ